jgi:hypothetical protein
LRSLFSFDFAEPSLQKLPPVKQRKKFTNRAASHTASQPNREVTGVNRRIEDEFTDLKISRQRKWQLRRAKEGKCIKCGARAAVGSTLCVRHHVKTALYNHERNNPGKKPLNSKWLKLASHSAI